MTELCLCRRKGWTKWARCRCRCGWEVWEWVGGSEDKCLFFTLTAIHPHPHPHSPPHPHPPSNSETTSIKSSQNYFCDSIFRVIKKDFEEICTFYAWRFHDFKCFLAKQPRLTSYLSPNWNPHNASWNPWWAQQNCVFRFVKQIYH
jgi:hypothetical protein